MMDGKGVVAGVGGFCMISPDENLEGWAIQVFPFSLA
jgi:hypothetical protein